MAHFHYTALAKGDKYQRGKVRARSSKSALKQLEKEGLLVINIKKELNPRWDRVNNMFQSVSRLDKIFFTRHLATMLDSGIGLDQALKITAEQTSNHRFRDVLTDLYHRVQKGQSLHSALANHPKYFSGFYISLVKVGESSGKLDHVLGYLLEQQERDYELITKTRGAMIYPVIIVSALCIIVVFMMTFVVPKVTGVLLEYNVRLPFATRFLIGASNLLLHFGIYLIPAIALLAYGIRRWLRTPRGKWYWDSFLLHVPRLNTIISELNLARLARAMSSMLKSGISIDQALSLAAGVAGHSHYQKSFQSSIAFVQKGIPMSEVLKGYPKLYPPLTSRMIDVGEKTGKLDHMFSRLAIFYEKSVLNTLSNLTSVIEPVLLLGIGLAVGFVGVAVLTPIWKFAETI